MAALKKTWAATLEFDGETYIVIAPTQKAAWKALGKGIDELVDDDWLDEAVSRGWIEDPKDTEELLEWFEAHVFRAPLGIMFAPKLDYF
jgi:hypothetical protein